MKRTDSERKGVPEGKRPRVAPVRVSVSRSSEKASVAAERPTAPVAPEDEPPLSAIGRLLDQKLKEQSDKMDKQLNEMGQRMKEHSGKTDKAFDEISSVLGHHNELLLRPQVREMFGAKFAKGCRIKSLTLLAFLTTIPELEGSATEEDGKEARIDLLLKNARKLAQSVNRHVPEFIKAYILKYHKRLRIIANAEWEGDDEFQEVLRVDPGKRLAKKQLESDKKTLLHTLAKLNEALNVENKELLCAYCDAAVLALRRRGAALAFARQGTTEPNHYAKGTASAVYSRIKGYFELETEGEQVSSLTSCNGLGLPAATWFAAKHPQVEVECDVRGKCFAFAAAKEEQQQASSVNVELGEIRSTLGSSSSTWQLECRCRLFMWAVRSLYPDVKTVNSVCHVFVPKRCHDPFSPPSFKDISFVVHRL